VQSLFSQERRTYALNCTGSFETLTKSKREAKNADRRVHEKMFYLSAESTKKSKTLN
jgi:hypothetical protein